MPPDMKMAIQVATNAAIDRELEDQPAPSRKRTHPWSTT
jgi:hypothetical protein